MFRKPSFDDNHVFRQGDILSLVTFYNEKFSKERSNYLRAEFQLLGGCRVYLTGKYDYNNVYGIGNYQHNVFSIPSYGDVRADKEYLPLNDVGRELVNADNNLDTLFELAELDPDCVKMLSRDVPPDFIKHDDWHCRYHYLNVK